MLHGYPRWKVLVLLISLLIGALYALPNLFGDDPAVQVLPQRAGITINENLTTVIRENLTKANIKYKRFDVTPEQMLVRFSTPEDQLKAKDIIYEALGERYIVALNLAPATPQWLERLGGKPVKLGLDLRGGVHFLMEVDVQTSIARRMDALKNDLRTNLRDEKLRFNQLSTLGDGAVLILFDASNTRDKANTALKRLSPELEFVKDDDRTGFGLLARLTPQALQEIRNYTVDQTITTLRNRVNELGVAEAVVQRQGANRIVVELPGIQDTARAKDILGKTATLEFRLVDAAIDVQQSLKDGIKSKNIYKDRYNRPVALEKRVILSGDSITGATVGTDSRDGRPVVNVRVGGGGLALFKKVTRENVGKAMAVLYIESHVHQEMKDEEVVRTVTKIEDIISVATIQSALGTQFQISGLTLTEAQDLSLLLRAGALPSTISIVEERTVGPSLGQENIQMGILSIEIGLGLVLVIMMLYYSVFGIIANITLVMNLILLVAILSLIGATLTLPGIAGIVLTLGMAVDANVLIFERIREEMRNGLSHAACIQSGFDRALSTIVDSNLTTLIVGVVLFSIGTGPVRGFSVTLCIGIVTSLFTAVAGTRALVHFCYGRDNTRKIRIGI